MSRWHYFIRLSKKILIMEIMKRYIISWMLLGIMSLWIFSSCEDYNFKDVPDPVVPEDMTPGLKLLNNEILIDAFGNAQGFELRAIGGKWSVEPEKETPWLLDYEPKSGDEGNAVVGVTLRVNEGMEERFCKLIVRQENTGKVDTVYVKQFTYESKYNRRTDSLAMLAVYKALKGENWMKPWNTRKPMTEWTGVILEEIEGEQRIVGLSLNDFKLSGDLANEIGNLRELRSLKVGGIGKVYKCPNSLINLRKLETLDVNFSDGTEWFLPNDMSSMLSLKVFKPAALKVPIESFAGFYTLPALEELNLSTMYLIGDLPTGISKMKSLKSLSLAGTNIYSLPDDIGELAENLTALDLRGCQSLASLGTSFSKLVNLTSLTLSGCKVLKNLPAGLGNLSGLTSLDLSSCEKLERLSEDFGNLMITTLNLKDCAALTGLPESFGNLVRLKKLTMSGTGMTELPAGLSGLVALEELDITGSYGGEGMSGIASEIFAGMPDLKTLKAGYNQFSGGLSWLKILTKLEVLDMSDNSLDGVLDFNDFASSCKEISLSGNQLSGTLEGISKLTNITRLNLRDNNLTGTIPVEVTRLTKFSWGGLGLSGNRLSGEIPSEVLSWNKWNNLSPTWNIYPQQDGYGFTNVP